MHKQDQKMQLYAMVIIIIMLFGIIILLLNLNMVTNVYEGDTQRDYDEYNDYYNDYDYDYDYWEAIEFTDVIYVHKDGSNADGESWDTAYTSINSALDVASSDLNDLTLIMIGPGEYDMNTAGVYMVNKNVHLFGVQRNLVIITNNHVGATGVIQFNRFGGLRDTNIDCGDNDIDGVIFNGTSSIDGRIYRVLISCNYINANRTGLLLIDGSSRLIVEDLHIIGDWNMTAVYLNNSQSNVFRNVYIDNCSVGIHLNDTHDDLNLFRNVNIRDCIIGIDIDAGNQQAFEELIFLGNTRNIDDEVGDSVWSDISLYTPISTVIPNDLSGIVVTAGVGYNNYGGDVEIYAAAASNNPFFVVAVMYNISTAENYGLKLSADGGTTYFFETVLTVWTPGEVSRITAEVPYIFNSATRISCSIKSETGGNTANVWIQIIEI